MALINKALLHPKEFNVDELKLQFDKEDEEIEQKKQEWAEVRKRMATERRYAFSPQSHQDISFFIDFELISMCQFQQGTIECIEKAQSKQTNQPIDAQFDGR